MIDYSFLETASPLAPARLDVATAEAQLVLYRSAIADLRDQAEAVKVTDAGSLADAIEKTSQIKSLAGRIDDKRHELVDEPTAYTRRVNAFAKPMLDDLETIEKAILKPKIIVFQVAEQKKIEAANETARKAAAELRAKTEQELATQGLPAPMLPISVPEQRMETVRTESGASAAVKKTWKCTGTTDITKVPAQYLDVNMQRVNAAIRSGVREIPGLTIEEVAEVAIRSGRK